MRIGLPILLLATFVACSEPKVAQTADSSKGAQPTESSKVVAPPAESPKDTQPAESPEMLLQTLYANHKPQDEKGIDFEDEAALTRYFTPELTALFLKDAACKEKSQELCNLDFDPVFAAQDFDAQPLDLAVEKQSETRYKVTFTNLTRRSLIYDLRNTEAGWRVDDITYPEGHALKALLSTPV